MESLLQKLQQKLQRHPDSKILHDLISHLSQVQNAPSQAHNVTWDTIDHGVTQLKAEGLWEDYPEFERLLGELRMKFANQDDSLALKTSHMTSPDVEPKRVEPTQTRSTSIVAPPPISSPLLPINPTLIPTEFIEVLNHAYFLHVLATDPERVLPPGKSLLSVMSQPHAQKSDPQGELPELRERVEDIVHRTFWDEALEKLSDPSPAIQLSRLKRLYEDLHVVLKPLLPSDHPLLTTLTCPLSPTSFPLRSAIIHLRELLVCLRKRCAPARDVYIDSLIHAIDELSSIASQSEMAKLVVDTVRSLLQLAEIMKDDLSQFVLGAMGEKQLKAVLIMQAYKLERELTLDLWKADSVQTLWEQWVGDSTILREQHHGWVHRLVQALGKPTPVSCPLPTVTLSTESGSILEPEPQTSEVNTLPPPLFLVCPTLLYLQNYLQALVIATSLRSLVRLSPPAQHSSSPPPASVSQLEPTESFIARIWTLLKAEVDGELGSGDTKLVNLADELVRVRRQFSAGVEPLGVEEEAKLRAAVDRTLQPRDPVFVLLQKRLLEAMTTRVVSLPELEGGGAQAHLPERLQTGRERPGKRPRLMVDAQDDQTSLRYDLAVQIAKEPALVVKGFEDVVLVKAIGEAVVRLRLCVEWTEYVWEDLIHTGKLNEPVSGHK